jgi:hypothetical protein
MLGDFGLRLWHATSAASGATPRTVRRAASTIARVARGTSAKEGATVGALVERARGTTLAYHEDPPARQRPPGMAERRQRR